MNEKTGTSFFVTLVLLTLLGIAPAYADSPDGWRVELDAMYLWPENADADVATRTRSTALGGGNFTPTELLGNIDAGPDADFAPRIEFDYREGEWGAGVNGWWIDADGAERFNPRSDAVGPPFPDPAGRNLDGVFVPSLSSVTTTIGDQGFYEDTALTVLDFQSDNDLEVWKLDLYGLRELVDTPGRQLDFLWGLELADFDNDRTDRVSELRPGVSDPGISRNTETDVQESSADWDLALGPMLGLQGHLKRDRHRFAGSLTQGLVYADIELSARITTGSREEFVDGTVTQSSSTLASISRNDDDWVPITEAKLQYMYHVTDRFSVGAGGFVSVWWDAELAPEFSRDQDETITFVGAMLSAEYRFGGGREPVAAVAAPPVAEPPPPVAAERVPFAKTLSVSTQTRFDFDAAELTADARRALDELVEQLWDKREIALKISGYSCRIGTQAYNQALSERRARAVQRYLEDKGVVADMTIQGCGEADPVVECPGLRGDALVQCLAPNRRTEIEVSAVEFVMPEESGAASGP